MRGVEDMLVLNKGGKDEEYVNDKQLLTFNMEHKPLKLGAEF